MQTFDLLTAVLVVLMAMCGTIARLLNTHEATRSKPSAILADLFVAGFVGLLFYMAVLSMPVETGWAFAASGVSGWVGPKILDTLAAYLTKKIGVDTPTAARGSETIKPPSVPDIEPEEPPKRNREHRS